MIREMLQSAVAAAAAELYKIKITPEISYPDPKFGDFSTNAAFQLAAQLKKNPDEIAQQLTKAIKHDAITSVKVAKGFLNFEISSQEWIRQLATVGPDFAKSNSGQGQTVLIEFISANPTGPLTLGNGRGGYSGDVLANALAAAGYQAQREYYVNDAGGQVTKLAQSVKTVASDKQAELAYSGEYVSKLAEKFKTKLDSKQLAAELTDFVLKQMIKPPVEKMGIQFDNWFSEKEQLHSTGKIEEMLNLLKEKQLIEEKAGAIWLKGTDENERDRVLVKSDGSFTYLLVDITYHWNKLVERKFAKVINLWGADHAGQAPSLLGALDLIGLGNRLDIIIFQLVRLIKDGKIVKVSKRAGTYVTLDELLNEIPSDVARFFFLMRSYDTHMDFDLDLAKQQSQKNPYYYVMYAYVRAQSILTEAAKKQLKPAATVSHQLSSKEKHLIRHILRLPDIVVDIASTYEVHRLPFYGLELAKAFHDYYEEKQIINLAASEAQSRLHTIAKLKTVLEVYFSLLGVKPVQRM